MSHLHSAQITVDGVVKEISVFCNDITRFPEHIDILTTSAYIGSYYPTPNTVFHALWKCGIHMSALALNPAFDLRHPCHVWLSKEVAHSTAEIGRIGCIEFNGKRLQAGDPEESEQVIHSIQSYFSLLDIAAVYGVSVSTVALPLLGSGSQRISENLMITPLINECISFLKRNPYAKKIYFIEKNPEKANMIAQALKTSLRFLNTDTPAQKQSTKKDIAFISYSSKDKNIADNLCSKLERNGIKVWYAPRDVRGPYADAIVTAIEQASYFIVILSQNSIYSEHVLNEIDLAFQNITQGTKIKPLRIDNALFTAAFKYYLSRQHWMDASIPPLEQRLNEFVSELLNKNT